MPFAAHDTKVVRGVTLRSREVDQPAFAQDVQTPRVGELVLLNVRPHLADPGGEVIERLQVDLRVEMP